VDARSEGDEAPSWASVRDGPSVRIEGSGVRVKRGVSMDGGGTEDQIHSCGNPQALVLEVRLRAARQDPCGRVQAEALGEGASQVGQSVFSNCSGRCGVLPGASQFIP